jgi:hypothetical protein
VFGDLRELERLCIEVVAQRNLDLLTTALTPRWNNGMRVPSTA